MFGNIVSSPFHVGRTAHKGETMKNERIALLITVAIMLAAFALTMPQQAAAQGQSGTTLTATKTAAGNWTRTFTWTIDKSVAPETLNMFKGDSGDATYTIAVTKDNGTDAYFVTGEICVTNGGAFATQDLKITDELQYKIGRGQFQTLSLNPVDLKDFAVLEPGESHCYAYNIPFTPVADAAYRNVAHITITNHAGYIPGGNNCPGPELCPFGPDPKADFARPASPALINDSVQVDDSNGESWSFTDSDSVSYAKTFSCDSDQGTHGNTATIRVKDGQSDSASVNVNCFALQVTKDASTSFDRTFSWQLSKSADQSSLLLALNQSFLVNYAVAASVTGSTDSNWAVNGNIAIHNPAPIDATLNDVADTMSDFGAVSVDCGVTFPYTLAAGADLNCTYASALPDASGHTNTATATLQNTPSGTTAFSGTANVEFGSATVTNIDTCITVDDSLNGALGTVCLADAPKTFAYSYQVGPFAVCGDRTINNTAAFVTNDTGATGSASAAVTANVPCATGCSLTIGYWKTHAGFGPQADMVTRHLPQWLGTASGAKSQNVTTAALAVQFLSFNGSNNVFDGSNGINKLYAQLLGTKLNVANGADSSAVASTISAADAFLANNNSTNWGGLTRAQKNQVNSWMSTLDNYNNGLIGPGHCSQ